MTEEKREKTEKKVSPRVHIGGRRSVWHTYIHYTEEEETKVEMVQWANVIPFSSDVCNTVTPPHPSPLPPVQPIFSMASISRSTSESKEEGQWTMGLSDEWRIVIYTRDSTWWHFRQKIAYKSRWTTNKQVGSLLGSQWTVNWSRWWVNR